MGSPTCEWLAAVGLGSQASVRVCDKTASSLLSWKLSPDFSHITQPSYIVTREDDKVRMTRKIRKRKTKKQRILNTSPSSEYPAWRSAIWGWTLKGSEENTERRARAGVRKRGKVGVQLGPIRAGPHVPTGGMVADRGGRREQRGQQGGSAESDGPRPCEALLGLSSALLNGAAHTRLQNLPPYLTPHPHQRPPPKPSPALRHCQGRTV